MLVDACLCVAGAIDRVSAGVLWLALWSSVVVRRCGRAAYEMTSRFL
jgi:hypothetical protein